MNEQLMPKPIQPEPSEQKEQREKEKQFVFIMLKPLAINTAIETRNELGEIKKSDCSDKIIKELELYGTFSDLVYEKTIIEQIAQLHYEESLKKPHGTRLIKYMANKTTIIGILVETEETIKKRGAMSFPDWIRKNVIGPSDPEKTNEQHLRNLVIQNGLPHKVYLKGEKDPVYDNLIHCSDSNENALREVGIWYGKESETYKKFEEKTKKIVNESQA